MSLVSVIDFSGLGTWYHESYAQKVCRLLRYSLTGTRICVRAVAQRGPDEVPERLPAEQGGGGIAFFELTVWSRYNGTPFACLNDEIDLDDLCLESDTTRQFWKIKFQNLNIIKTEYQKT